MTIGAKFRAKGYTPHKPIIVVPGLCSSCLVVQESPFEDWVGQQIWLNLGSIGFDKIFLGNVLRNIRNPKKEQPKTTVEIDQTQKRKWIQHMILEKDAITDPEGIKVRAVKGLKGCAYLETHTIMNGLSYVMGPLFETLQDAGYTDKNLRAAPYDWRVPPSVLEERDCYFTELKQMVQQMYAENNSTKVVLLGHSLGTRVIHYFLIWLEDTVGRSWIDEKIDLFIPVGPLWLGAPKSIRAAVTGERMGLEDFLYPEEGLQLARRCGSSGWMYPFHTPDCEFQSYSYLRDEKTGQFVPKSIQEIMEISHIPYQWQLYDNMFIKNKYFGPQEDMLKPPPIGNIFAIYGINLKTESFYFFKKNTSNTITELELDTDSQFPNYVCEGGIAYETKETKQNMLRGRACSGDGTVTYASLAYCKKWRGSIKVRVEELDQADHRVILKDKRFHRLVLEAICKPPLLENLPSNFQLAEYEASKVTSGGKVVKATLKLNRKGIKLKFSIRKKNNFYPLASVSNLVADPDPQTFRFNTTKPSGIVKVIVIKSPHRDTIITEIMQRRRFMEEGTKWEEEARNSDGQTELHVAVVENRVDNVVKMLHEGADINAVDNNCQTPLHLAAIFKHYEVAMVLLQQSDIDVEKVSTEGNSILHYWVRIAPENDEEIDKFITILELIKSKGAEVTVVNNAGLSCLHEAINYGSSTSVNWLLEKKANINIGDKNGNTPLHHAIMAKNQEIIQNLLQNGADKHITNKLGESSLKLAKNDDTIFNILSLGASMQASSNKNSGVVLEAIRKNTRQITKRMEVDEYGQTLLHKAAYDNRLDTLLSLIIAEACEINYKDRNGWTALHCAANKGNLDACIMLMNTKNIDVNAMTNDETYVLHYLSRLSFNKVSDSEKLVNVLNMAKERGLMVNVKEKYGETPLHQAAIRGNFPVAKWLLENQCQVNYQTSKNQDTPLHYAVHSKKLELIRILIEYGADPTIPNARDGTPMDLARKINVKEVIDILTTTTPKLHRATTFSAGRSTLRSTSGGSSTFRMGHHKSQILTNISFPEYSDSDDGGDSSGSEKSLSGSFDSSNSNNNNNNGNTEPPKPLRRRPPSRNKLSAFQSDCKVISNDTVELKFNSTGTELLSISAVDPKTPLDVILAKITFELNNSVSMNLK